ncbi:MAG: amidase [Hyphomonadaceae bacterium]|nr:amidase [Hyphomonadaceae bacterium]
MRFDEYRRHDAIGLAALIANGDISPDEALDAALERAEAVNGKINAIILDLEDEARAAIAAGLPQGPLRGVPMPIKDISVHMRGHPTGAGSRLFASQPASEDSALIRLYREAGMVLFAKTNTPEFGLSPITAPRANGATRNPWDIGRTSGGSSGGAAAAVAAGVTPAAHGSDGGGSIRIPASCCGLFGLKPSRGRVSLAPSGEGWGGLSVQHALTRSVRDSALLLDIACTPQLGDPYWIDPPRESFLSQVGRDPGRLRIAFTDTALTFGAPEAPCAQAVRDTAALLASLGHHVEEARPQLDYHAMAAHGSVVVSTSVAAMLNAEATRRGAPVREDEVEALTWLIYQSGLGVSGAEGALARQQLYALGREMCRFFANYDMLVLPTLAQPPLLIGALDSDAKDLSGYAEELYAFMPNTQPFNASGQPAASIPLAWHAGLPIGVQVVARPGDEAGLIRLAAQLEQAQPWFDRVAPL